MVQDIHQVGLLHVGSRGLMAQQPSLHLKAVGISGEAAVLADDAVTRDDDR